MIDERANNRPATDEELLDFVRAQGIKTTLDIRIQEVRNNTFRFSLIPSRWKEYKNVLHLTEDDWLECKYFNESNHIHKNIQQIPNNKGGIYMYVIKPPLTIRYMPIIMYIGRAHNDGEKQNLRKRIRKYLYESQNIYNGRVSIRTLFDRYAEYLYVMYTPLDDNGEIDQLEENLISAIVPPFNHDLIQKSLKEGRHAF